MQVKKVAVGLIKCMTVLFCSSCLWSTVDAKKKDLMKNAQDLLDKEIEQCQKLCSTSKLSNVVLDEMRFDSKTKAGKVVCCHLKQLFEDPVSKNAGWLWAILGHLYASSSSKSSANTCFKQATKLTGKISESIPHWHFLGPFVIGKIEVDGDPIEQYGGIRKVAEQRHNKKKKYASELSDKGEVTWKIFKGQGQGQQVQIVPEVDWNDLVRSLGSMAITEWQGWLVGEFAVNDNNVNVILQCHGVHTVFIDELPIVGDLYRRNQFWFAVPLSKGIHTVYIRVRATANGAFGCQVDQAKSAFEILKPHFLPDLLDGFLFSQYIALPISNLHATKWLKINHVTISEQPEGKISAKLQEENIAVSLAPGQTNPVGIKLSTTSDDPLLTTCSESITLNFKLKISTSDGHVVYPLSLRCRKRHESFLFTFLDHDGSIQHAAAIEPVDEVCMDPVPVLLTLHGTTVPPQNQADSYKRMEGGAGGQFIFGVEKAWLLAPTRHGAHNWEGPGALTALTAADRLDEMTRDTAWLQCKANSQHLIIAGHSMGGHGAWHIATHYPDRTLALLSLAGWIKKEEYGDSNLFFKHDISTSSTDPATKAIMEATIAENDADRHVSNLKGIDVLARIGSSDRTIHPYFVRRMHRLLLEEKIKVSYIEVPGKEHWWWDTRSTNDGGCVNDQQLRDFTNAHVNIPLSNGECETAENGEQHCESKHNIYKELKAEKFTHVVLNPAFGGSMRGLNILRQVSPHITSSIQVECGSSECNLTTTNVRHFSIKEAQGREMGWASRALKVDEQDITPLQIPCDLYRIEGEWKVLDDKTVDVNKNLRPLKQLGPARRVAEQPFLIVVGSQSSNSSVDLLLLTSATYISNQFFLTSDTNAPVVMDTQVDDNMKESYNLIVVGGPGQNLLAADLLSSLPIKVEANGVSVGSCKFTSSNTGAMFLAPNGEDKLALVLLGNTEDALQDVVSLAAPTIPPMARSPFSNLLPDYVVTGPFFRQRGPGGYLCAGFWGHTWDLTPELSSCSYCAKNGA